MKLSPQKWPTQCTPPTPIGGVGLYVPSPGGRENISLTVLEWIGCGDETVLRREILSRVLFMIFNTLTGF